MKDLEGKVAAVTGTASGIGRATAVLLAREGCACAIADINEEGLRETEREIEALGAAVHATVLDVADREAVYAWADEVAREFGRVNLIVNNAGVSLGATIDDMTYEDMDWLLGINLFGVIYGTKAFLPHLKRAGEGHVVNISSVEGLVAVPTQSAYVLAKFAVKGFTESLRLEMDIGGENIGATVVYPGGIKTNIARDGRVSESLLEEIGMSKDEMAGNFDRMARITPEAAAAKIVDGIKKNKSRVLIGPEAYFLDILKRLAPTGYLKFTTGFFRLMEVLSQRKGR